MYQSKKAIRVLLIGNSESDRDIIEDMLNPKQFKLSFAPSETCPECMVKGAFDIILFLDVDNAVSSGSLKRCIEQALNFPTIIISDHSSGILESSLIGKGIQDYLFKGQFDGRMLRRSIIYAIERSKIMEELLFKNKVLSEIKDSVVAIDGGQNIIYWNSAAERLYGLKSENVIGKKISEPLFQTLGIDAEMMRELKKSGTWRGEREQRESGIIVESELTLMRDASENPVGVISVSRDITKRRSIESDMRRMALFPEMTPNPIVDVDFFGKILYMNPLAASVFPDMEASGTSHKFFANWGSILKTFENEKAETINREINIEGRWFFQQIHHIPTTSFIRIYALDITERKNVESELDEKDQQLSLALESAKMAAWTLDPVRNKVDTIGNIAYLYGFPAMDFMHQGLEIVHQDDLKSYSLMIKSAILKGTPYHYEFRIIRPDNGKIAWLDERAVPIKDRDGNLKMLAGVVQDITERKLAENGIKKSLDEKEVLLKEVHHRVKNNLQMISSLLHLQSFLAKGKAHDMLRDSQNRIRSISLVHEILYQSKDFTNISSRQYFSELLKRIMASYPSKSISTEVVAEDVPIKINTAITCGLITNELVINSIKHAFKDANGKISLYFNQRENNNILTIKDDGIGISKSFSFDKTHSLGLKLVRSFAEQLEGKIDFRCNGGTTFTITFPKG